MDLDERAREYAPVLLLLFLQSAEWAARRTEKVNFIDDVSVERAVTYDINLPAILSDEVAEGLPELIIPFNFLNKKPLVGFSLSDGGGQRLSILTQTETTAYALEVVMEVARRLGVNAEQLRPRIRDIIDLPAPRAVGELKRLASAEMRPADRAVARVLMENGVFKYLVHMLARKFMALAVCPKSFTQRPALLKYTSIDHLRWRGLMLARRIAWAPTTVNLFVSSLRLSGSYHIEVKAPESLDIADVRVSRKSSLSAEGSEIASTRVPVAGLLLVRKCTFIHVMVPMPTRTELQLTWCHKGEGLLEVPPLPQPLR